MATILFADDEAYLLESIIYQLREDGNVVIVANNAERCLEKLRANVVDLLVIDIMMPSRPIGQIAALQATLEGIDSDISTGVRLYEKVKQEFPRIIPVILSALPKEDVLRRNQGASFDCVYLLKRYDATISNLSVIRSILNQMNRP